MREKILRWTACGFLLMANACGASAPMTEAAPPGGYRGGMAAPAAMPARYAGVREESLGDSDDSGELASMAQTLPAASAAPVAPSPTSTGTTPAPTASAVRAPMLIYTAQMTMAVFQVADASKHVEEMSRELGGFLAKRDDASITIRVPAAKFEEAIKRLEKLGDVLHRNVEAEDVTEQYLDLEIRMKSARAMQARLVELLAKAAKVEEALAVEKELERIRTEIERLEGRLKYLRDRAQFSTITVSFQAKQTDNVNQNNVRIPVPWLNQLGLGRLLQL